LSALEAMQHREVDLDGYVAVLSNNQSLVARKQD
jgi:hypothetical protein